MKNIPWWERAMAKVTGSAVNSAPATEAPVAAAAPADKSEICPGAAAPQNADNPDSDEDDVLLPPGMTQEDDTPPPAADTTAPAKPGETLQPGADSAPHGDSPMELSATLIAALTGAGIDNEEKFASLQARAANGDLYAEEAKTELSAHATRLFGPDKGPKFAASMAHLPVSEQKIVAKDWAEQADAKSGIIGENGKDGAPRVSAPSAVALDVSGTSADAPPADTNASAWDRLTNEQREHGTKMGYKTAARREAYAKQVLKDAE